MAVSKHTKPNVKNIDDIDDIDDIESVESVDSVKTIPPDLKSNDLLNVINTSEFAIPLESGILNPGDVGIATVAEYQNLNQNRLALVD